MWTLVSLQGKLKGRHWEVTQCPLVIGRSFQCGVVIEDPSVSRRHCQVQLDGNRIRLKDLGSAHPPLVNADVSREGVLRAGDMLSIGSATFVVTQGQGGPRRDNQDPQDDETGDFYTGRGRDDLDGRPVTEVEGRPQSVSELVGLFELARCLSRANTRTMLNELVIGHLKEVNEFPGAAITLLSEDRREIRWYPDAAAESPTLKKSLADLLNGKGPRVLRLPPEQADSPRAEFVIAAPLLAGGRCCGALLAHSAIGQTPFCERDLNRLLSVAHVVAPYYQTAGHLERLEDTVAQLDDQAAERGPLVGKSRVLRKVRGLIRDVAPTELSILITGETGTGKELAAKMIHDGSARADGPFIAINCAAIPDHLFESEMFGHEKGAFTSADKKRKGRFALADGGTLFLDEIGELAPDNQARLLRVLESGHFHPVGAEQESHVDVRVIAATNRDLKRAIRDGRFRRDLYHRICSVEIPLPALRQRPSDIPLLAQHFARELTRDKAGDQPSLTDDALAYLQALPWTGNVRELRNAIERVTALAKAPRITPRDLTFLEALLPAAAKDAHHRDDEDGGARVQTLAEIERQHITHVLEQCNYNVSKAARMLGVHRNTLHNKIAAYGIGG